MSAWFNPHVVARSSFGPPLFFSFSFSQPRLCNTSPHATLAFTPLATTPALKTLLRKEVQGGMEVRKKKTSEGFACLPLTVVCSVAYRRGRGLEPVMSNGASQGDM